MATKKSTSRKKSAARRAADAPRPVAVTTFRIFRDQLIGLQRLALDRRAQGLSGRMDASAVLREILDRELDLDG